MKLVYSFTRKLSTSNLEWQMKYYSASITRAKKLGYFIKLYGCDFTESYLKTYVDEFINIENQEFILTDDLKLWIHSQEDLECITIDGDIILNSKLIIPNNFNVMFDFCVNIKSANWQFKNNLKLIEHLELNNYIEYFNYDGNYSCNVGILKFNNVETKNLLINNYYKFREYFIKNVPNGLNVKDPATIICEYYFARILEHKKISHSFFKNFNHYTHYIGDKKNTKEFKDIVESLTDNLKTHLI